MSAQPFPTRSSTIFVFPAPQAKCSGVRFPRDVCMSGFAPRDNKTGIKEGRLYSAAFWNQSDIT